jgi:ParB family chromosome partitioning protein
MAKKSGLGKGLNALFADTLEDEIEEVKIEEKVEGEVVQTLKITEVEPNRNQPRKHFDEEALEELADSIKKYGLIQPIVVTKKDGYYQIIAGERRWRASKKAGLTEIPAIIREDNEQRNKEISLIENIQREDLNPIEKARGIKQLMDEYDLTQQRVADILGKSRSAIANSVRILNLDERVINLALEGKLTEGHCRSSMSITDPEKQYEVAVQIIEQGDSVREVEKKVKVRKKAPKKAERYAPIYRDIENSFQTFFGTKVKLDAGERKGKIIIQYSSNDDLERILGLIK